MVGARTPTAVVVGLASLAVSAAVWYYTGVAVLLLVVPFVPLLVRWAGGDGTDEPPPVRSCPVCGFRSRDPSVAFCPRDGTELEER